MYTKILVAVDGSENSRRAAEHAAHLASLSSAKVHILYVLDYDRTRSDVLLNAGSADLHDDRRKRMAPIEELFERSGIAFDFVIRHGAPGPTIVNFANEGNFDLVIIGSRGLNSFQEMVLGSVSHKVAKRVVAPVLIVK